MNEKYDSLVAGHYAAYRPPLHRIILERVIRSDESFKNGLDVGCGTGYSAIALTDHCDHVLGLDSSQDMLSCTEAHADITYLCGNTENLSQLPIQSFDVITFAGSLLYTKSAQLRDELMTVMTPESKVIIYDFELLLDDVMAMVVADFTSMESSYDYTICLSDWAGFTEESGGRERVQLSVSVEQLAHVLLSDSNRYEVIQRIYPDEPVFDRLVARLSSQFQEFNLYADIYYRKYGLI